MKRIYIYWIAVATVFTIGCTTKQDVFDTGLAKTEIFEGSVLDYLKQDTVNFSYVIKLIEIAELEDLYDGRVDSLPQITFFPYKCEGIYNFMKKRIPGTDFISKEEAKLYLLARTAKGRYTRKEIRKKSPVVIEPLLKTKTYEYTKGLYVIGYFSYMNIPGAGGADLIVYIAARHYGVSIRVEERFIQTSDLKTRNGVIHVRPDDGEWITDMM